MVVASSGKASLYRSSPKGQWLVGGGEWLEEPSIGGKDWPISLRLGLENGKRKMGRSGDRNWPCPSAARLSRAQDHSPNPPLAGLKNEKMGSGNLGKCSD